MSGIAVIGMACRVPGARTVAEYWRNLSAGVESIARLSDDELRAAGVDAELLRHPDYVRAAGVLDDVELFDAAFFGLSAREAEILDVQHRIFLECAWEALEDACCMPDGYRGSIGVYAGAGMNAYLLANLLPQREALAAAGGYQALLANDKDFLPTRVSYKLNLRGPSVSVQTACSTSLVAIHMACQALLAGECDVALAGGVSIRVPQRAGYLHEEGMILSRDGHCRAFDAAAGGTVPGSGAGVVVLKRLEDALAEGDRIDAVVLGSAVNNDGAQKVGYTAPSIDGQRAVIAEALAVAGVDPATIAFVETHGTGTTLGDPIEFAALSQAFGSTGRATPCVLGAVKTNLGHLDAAAGVAGFIKAVLALKHEAIPPTLHFTRPNPQIDLTGNGFRITTRLEPWPKAASPARAGVSSFGIGGTNAHVVLEEGPALAARPESRGAKLLVLSARTPGALEAQTRALAAALTDQPALDLGDVAWSLQTGRQAFEHRCAVVASSTADAARALSSGAGDRGAARTRSVVFMFPGQGSQAAGMAARLYETAPVFRATLDACCQRLDPKVRELLLTTNPTPEQTAAITSTRFAQPALFTVSFALAQQLRELGVEPAAMIGHSIGEYVAACIGGTLSLDEALSLVSLRGALMDRLPSGRMVAVRMKPDACARLLTADVTVAAVNAPELCVLSGPEPAVKLIEARCAADGVDCHALQTSHAFHSPAMDPILDEFAAAVARVRLSPPSMPWISNLTGEPIASGQATDPKYWVRHLRETVLFGRGIETALSLQNPLLLEVGPGRALSTLALEQPAAADAVVVACMKHPRESADADEVLLRALGRLFVAGVPLRWDRLDASRPRRRVSLPTYPFERQRYWIDPPASGAPVADAEAHPKEAEARPIDRWFHVPVWRSAPMPPAADVEGRAWLFLARDDDGVTKGVMERLRAGGARVIVAVPGREFAAADETRYTLRPEAQEDYVALFADLRRRGIACADLVHALAVDADGRGAAADAAAATATLEEGFFSLLWLARALADAGSGELRLRVLSSRMQPVGVEGQVSSLRAAVLGPVLVIPRELPIVVCRSIDYVRPADRAAEARLGELLYREVAAEAGEPLVAYRQNQRLVRDLSPVTLPAVQASPLRAGGHYVITGGGGGIGQVIALHLARACSARVTLLGRSEVPAPVIAAIESAGGQAWSAAVDVAELEALRDAVRQARARFGAINGVIHAAGVAAGGLIALKTRAEVERVWRPKVVGAGNLARVFEGAGLDFLIFMSSLTGVRGDTGQVDYCAAGAVLDAMAHELRARGERALSLDWDTWREVGMAVTTKLPPALQALREQQLEHAIGSADGIEAFTRALAGDLTQAVITPRDPAARRDDERLPQAAAQNAVAPAAGATNARPVLATAFAAPETPSQQALCRIWQSLLGVEPIGIDDNFFELGGHSLLATQVLSRVRQQLEVRLTLGEFFERPTVAALAALVEQRQLDAILADVDSLSDEDVARQLAAAPGETGEAL